MSTLNSPTEAAPPGVPPLSDEEAAMAHPARPDKTPARHPGIVLADLLDENRLSVRAVAEAIGLSHATLNKVLNETGPITAETAARLAAYFGTGAELWLNLQSAYDLAQVRERLAKDLARIKPFEPR